MTDDRPAILTEEVKHVVSMVAEAAMDRAAEAALEHGCSVLRMFVSVHLKGMPEGEMNAIGAAGGSEMSAHTVVRQRQLLEFLLDNTKSVAKALGYDVALVPAGSEVRIRRSEGQT